jgi:hypothetical protein
MLLTDTANCQAGRNFSVSLWEAGGSRGRTGRVRYLATVWPWISPGHVNWTGSVPPVGVPSPRAALWGALPLRFIARLAPRLRREQRPVASAGTTAMPWQSRLPFPPPAWSRTATHS